MSWLVAQALRFRVLVLAFAIVLLIWGTQIIQQSSFDVFPEFALPKVEIQTEAPGLSTVEVESLITLPLENALNGTPFIKTLRSKSVLGLSSVVLLFEPGTDLLKARQSVQERIALATENLPAVSKAPIILQPLSSTSRALKIGIWSDTLSQMELTEIARWKIRPRLLAVRGVANVPIWGRKDKQFQVLVNPARLRSHDVTLKQVQAAAQRVSTLGGGGIIETPNQVFAIRHRSSVQRSEDVGNALLEFRDGHPLLLKDVADVVTDHPPPIGDAIINDQLGLLLIVEKQPWGNTLEVTREVEKALEELKPGLKDVEFDSTIFRPATFIERSIENLGKTLLHGCLLVAAILILFLYEWRSALITILAIPLSLLGAAIVLYYTGSTINTMILAGLVIAVGEVVDDAIIDVENISRRLHLNKALENPKPAYEVVLMASLEVRSAVVYASLIIVLVFIPVFFLEGLAGAFFRPLAWSYVLAIFVSLVTALTITPALCLMLLPNAPIREKEVPFVKWLKALYRPALSWVINRSVCFVGLVLLGVVLASAFLLSQLGTEFLPHFQETDFLMHWVEKPGTSIEAMNRSTIEVSKELRALPEVRNFGSHIGRAEVADEVVGPNFTELWISIDDKANYPETVDKIQKIIDGYPGLKRDVLTYLKERIKEVLSGASATIVVRIFGPDLAKLRSQAATVKAAMGEIDGVIDLKIESQVLVPQIQVQLRPEAAARFGLTAQEVREAATTLIKGTKVGEVYEEQKIYDIVLWGTKDIRDNVDSIRTLMIDTANGGQVPMGDIADIAIVPTPNAIKREGASRRIDVTCNVRGRDLGSVAKDIKQRVRQLSFESGYHPEILGEYEALEQSRDRLGYLLSLTLFGIFLLLYTDFQSWRAATLVFLTLPFALIGGIWGAFIGGGVISLGSMIGFITVLGITSRNGIMLVSHFRHLENEEGHNFGRDLVLRGAEERLAPILMTALSAGLALIPLVIAGNLPGHEIEYPMAFVILGGLFTSTLLNLFLVPTFYRHFGKGKQASQGDA
ncbi:MAG: efflux RND transporter permease subunit [Planctomycetota bacterium]|nr:efflux RND transporter permease subunit [Planctomycetota bacterium]